MTLAFPPPYVAAPYLPAVFFFSEPNLFSRIADALGLASSQPHHSDAVASSSHATPQEQNPKHDVNAIDDNDGVAPSTTVPVAGPGIGQSTQLPPPQPRAQQEPLNKSGTTKDVDGTLAPKSGQGAHSHNATISAPYLPSKSRTKRTAELVPTSTVVDKVAPTFTTPRATGQIRPGRHF